MSPHDWLRQGKSVFEIYLRTGVNLAETGSPLALKYNPWHDIEDGRFTRVGMGRKVPPRFGGYGGGGGGFDGAGASGSWDGPGPAKPKPKPKLPEPRDPPPVIVRKPVPAPRERPVARSSPSPVAQTIQANGYTFGLDAQFLPRKITGTLTGGPRSKRSRSMQANAGKPDRLPTDDGGHYIATRFNGPREKFNHFAQDSNVNRGRYRALEDDWARDLAKGKKVIIDIRPRFRGGSVRPYEIDIIWHTDGREQSMKLTNDRRK